MIALHRIAQGVPCAPNRLDAPSAPHLLFLHGLEGDPLESFGTRGHAGAFPRRLAQAFPGCAVTSIGYPASVARFKAEPDFTLATIEDAFAPVLEDLIAGRPAVAIVGYCLGGLLAASRLRSRHASAALPPTLLFVMDTPLVLPERDDPYPEISAGLGLTRDGMAASVRWLREDAGKAGLRLVSILSEAPGWLAPYGRDALCPPSPLHIVPGDHLALAAAPETGEFAPLTIVRAAIDAFLATATGSRRDDAGVDG